ncbi:MAG: hypothetical protein J07HN4v3_02632 [Halonotius sp. J07HN4]|nr:MAG: hypothetical protein J07HN4v3_02632 [Halonotius sp. J07HN4]
MTSRRQLLRGVAGTFSVVGGLRWGGLVAPADAQSSETASESDASGDDEKSSDADEGDPTGLPGYTVGQIYLRYEEHVGITTFVELENQTDEGHDRVQLEADARGPNDTLGTDKTWETVPVTSGQSVKLRIDNVFDLYNAVDNVTELVIRGRVPDGKNHRDSGVFRQQISDRDRERWANQTRRGHRRRCRGATRGGRQ